MSTQKLLRKRQKKFYNACFRYAIESIHVSREMVEAEIKRHKRDTVLTDNERLVLSQLYGIPCDQNPDGLLLSSPEIQKTYGFSVYKASNLKIEGLQASQQEA